MHVKTTRRKRGDKTYEYLSLVESVRVDGKNTYRTLLRLGEVTALRASGELERVISALEFEFAGIHQAPDEVVSARYNVILAE